jgi:hypothetical protein
MSGEGDKAEAEAVDDGLPSIRARLLAIAAVAEAEKTAPMLTIARAALMDAAKLIGQGESRTEGGKAELTLEDLLEKREARLRANGDAVRRHT